MTEAKKEVQVTTGADVSTTTLNGTKFEITPDGNVVVYTNGKVTVKPAPANDTSAIALLAGQKMADGSVFAGMTADGKSEIYAMPEDLDVTMTFNDAAKAVKKLNNQKALGHDDWQIGSIDVQRVLCKNQNEGALKGTFNTSGNKESGSGYPGWYLSSTQNRDYSSCVRAVRLSDGVEDWGRKDNVRFSCRPVRLVPV